MSRCNRGSLALPPVCARSVCARGGWLYLPPRPDCSAPAISCPLVYSTVTRSRCLLTLFYRCWCCGFDACKANLTPTGQVWYKMIACICATRAQQSKSTSFAKTIRFSCGVYLFQAWWSAFYRFWWLSSLLSRQRNDAFIHWKQGNLREASQLRMTMSSFNPPFRSPLT